MDRYRPRYHFTAQRNWMNDPNGPFQRDGVYHLFYQHNPSKPEWGDIHWGHATSTDLVNWTHKPIALAPSRELGEVHVFSGCSVVNGDEVIQFYTSIGDGDRNPTNGAQQWMSRGTDMTTWVKPDINPVLTAMIHGELDVTEWRDPFVWREQDGWRMLLGGSAEGKGSSFIYRSEDLENWSYIGIFHQGDEQIWECPHIFRFGDKAVVFYSPSKQVRYISGTFSGDKLTDVRKHGTVDYSGFEGYYASTGFVDEQGRRVMHGWIPEGRGEEFPVFLNWAGALALPRIVELKENGAIAMVPVPELETLRGEKFGLENIRAKQDPVNTGVRSTCFESLLTVDRTELEKGELVVSVFVSPCRSERTDVRLNLKANTVEIDRSKSSLFPNVHKTPVRGELPAGESTVNLRIFADQSIIEVFVDDETCLTARAYPSLEDSDGFEISSSSELVVSRMDIWKMNAANIFPL
ncbi:glycoside hydrolase family 32 protein [Paenibacillus sp. 5J-6]|uniref:beta-fructofuranosidase n=1 Tax=Paenibacillus silvestris TaxID=2606219 RepID=A0A6L8V569_9BACL|nr:glycoside hydrolase family 32 protein [Paenibacillus silvestris]MZQ85364.1 glycoside hydrolase family 32 protein [Paenibacillus silvestris]